MDSTEPTQNINCMTCTPDELQKWLLQYRFRDEPSQAVAFLQQTISRLQKKNTSDPVTPESVYTEEDLGKPLLKNSDNNLEVSLTTPRVKAEWVCYESGMRFTDKKGESMIIRKAKHMVAFPKPEDCNSTKKNATDMVLLIPDDDDRNGTTYKTKKQAQICFQLPSVAPDWDEDMESLDHADQWIAVVCRSCGIDVASVARVINPALQTTTAFWRYQFQSHQEESTSTTTGGMPFVKCYHGVNDGALYPLLEGLLFFKPPLFIPRSEMESIGCGRDNGSRYVDLQVTRAGKQLDFSNIHRAEVNELRDYIHQKLIPAMKKDISSTGESPRKPRVAETDSEKDLDGEVQVLEQEEDASNRSRKRRKASLEAEVVNRQSVGADSDDDDEEDGDMDYEAGMNNVDDEDSDEESEDEESEDDNFEEQETETESEEDDE